MARSSGQKLKLLYLKDFLMKNSDENHPVSVAQMIAYLNEMGLSGERKSIYSDIEALEDYGLEIQQVRGKSTGYYVLSRDFELPEVKLLVDIVQSSRFITEKKTLSLIEKIESLASVHDARKLHREVYVQNRVKAMNESVYYNVDALSEAIALGKKAQFRYFDYLPDKTQKYRRDGAFYVVSPHFLVWDNENYYLVALPEGGEAPRHYRIDKMSDIGTLDTPAVLVDIDRTKYLNSLFGMYAGNTQNVRLRFNNYLSSVVVDRFGKNIIFAPDGDEHFTVNVEVSVSPQFWGWVFGLGNGVEILSPPEVREQMQAELLSRLEKYR